MDKELIDRVWKTLPAEFKEEVKKYYRTLHEQYKEYDGLHFETAIAKVQERIVTLEYFFGDHNLTSDAEGEPKPAEPKFKVGDIAVVRGFKHPLLEHDGAIVTILSHHEKGDFYSCAIAPNVGIDVDAKYLEPYTEPEESANISQNITNCDKQFDNILKDSCSKERRLSIATQIMSAILSNQRMLNNLASGETTAEGVVKSIVNTTMMYTDALMVEAEKGGCHV